MKFDIQKAFPYPVLRPYNDDFTESEIQTITDFEIDNDTKIITCEIMTQISSDDINELIEKKLAFFVYVVSCRSTYFRKTIKTSDSTKSFELPYGSIKDQVEVSIFIISDKKIENYKPDELNSEFGNMVFTIEKGQVLALGEPSYFYFDRDSFKPVTSIFNLVKDNNRSNSEWLVSFDDDYVVISVSPEIKMLIDQVRVQKKHQAVLLNSIYFSALVEAINSIKYYENEYSGYKWAKVLTKAIHNKDDCSLNDQSYFIAQKLLKGPISKLSQYVFIE